MRVRLIITRVQNISDAGKLELTVDVCKGDKGEAVPEDVEERWVEHCNVREAEPLRLLITDFTPIELVACRVDAWAFHLNTAQKEWPHLYGIALVGLKVYNGGTHHLLLYAGVVIFPII